MSKVPNYKTHPVYVTEEYCKRNTEGDYKNIPPDIQQWFKTVDSDHSGRITAQELKSALINAQGKHFSDIACHLMIDLFDDDKNRTIDLREFQQLYSYINSWLIVFRGYDKDNSGSIEYQELVQAFVQMGYRLSEKFVGVLMRKSDPVSGKSMSIDQFIVVCIQLQKFTQEFRRRDLEMNGIINIGFEDFLTVLFDVMPSL